MIITIDGPTASGKSSVARHLACQLSAYYVYSGLLYRALAYALSHDFEYLDDAIATPAAEHVQACVRDIAYICYDDAVPHIYYRGVEITQYLKTSAIDRLASRVSVDPEVRDAVTRMQHDIAKSQDVVVDGRDAGTIVFPAAEIKFYITAASYIRAMRWRKDQQQRGFSYSLHQSLQQLRERDYRDIHRCASPLVPAIDAYHIDNSQLDIQQTVALMSMITHHSQ